MVSLPAAVVYQRALKVITTSIIEDFTMPLSGLTRPSEKYVKFWFTETLDGYVTCLHVVTAN